MIVLHMSKGNDLYVRIKRISVLQLLVRGNFVILAAIVDINGALLSFIHVHLIKVTNGLWANHT